MPTLSTPQQALARELRSLLAAHREARDLIEIGAYRPGTNPTVDRAVALRDQIESFLRQGMNEVSGPGEAWHQLSALLSQPTQIEPAFAETGLA